MGAIYKRELKSAFTGMTGPIFIAYVLVFMGFFAVSIVLQGLSPNFEYVVLSAGFFSMLAVPVLTMRSLPEERHNKTDQLLFSLPITTLDIVLGKYLAMITVLAVPVGVISVYPLVSLMFVKEGSLNFLTIYGTILCYFLLGCAVIGICMFLSSMTESQVISAIVNIESVISTNPQVTECIYFNAIDFS
jgi:ABC-2 type transport system permease protein